MPPWEEQFGAGRAGVENIIDASGQKPGLKHSTVLPPLTRQLTGRSTGQNPIGGGAQGPMSQLGVKARSMDEADEQLLPAARQTVPPLAMPQLRGWVLFGQPIPLWGVQGPS